MQIPPPILIKHNLRKYISVRLDFTLICDMMFSGSFCALWTLSDRLMAENHHKKVNPPRLITLERKQTSYMNQKWHVKESHI